MRRSLLLLATTTTALTALALLRAGDAAAQASPSAYDRAFDEGARLEREGRPREAADVLTPVSDAHPQDYAAALRVAWLRYRAGDYAAARERYRRALDLSAGASIEARLGLAWTLRAQGRDALARREFQRVLQRSPDNASALEGLAPPATSNVALPTPRAVRVWPALSVGAQLYANHPTLRGGWSLSPSLTAVFGEAFLVSASYRLVRYDVAANAAAPAGSTAGATFTQQDAWLSLGLVRPSFSLQLHGGYVWDPNNAAVPAYVLGASGTFDLLGTLRLEGSGTAFADGLYGRAALSWGFRLSEGFLLGPTASAQLGPQGFGGSFGALARGSHRWFSLSLAGRYGDERRPTFLGEALVYANNGGVRGSVSASARAELGAGLALAVGYEWQRLTAGMPPSPPQDSDAHYFTAGLSGAF